MFCIFFVSYFKRLLGVLHFFLFHTLKGFLSREAIDHMGFGLALNKYLGPY